MPLYLNFEIITLFKLSKEMTHWKLYTPETTKSGTGQFAQVGSY